MATIVAQANGNWSNPATWTGGVVPGAGDIAQTGNYIVTIDASVTCTLNPTGSGYFVVTTGGITITGDLVMSSSYTGGGLRCTHTAGTVELTGTATAGAGASAHGAFNAAAGTLTVGTATGGAGQYAYGAYNGAAGTLTVGTATGGAGNGAYGAHNNAAGTLTCDLAIGSNWGPGGTGNLNPGVYGTGVIGQTTKVKRVQSGAYGAPGIWGFVLIEPDASNSAQFRLTPGGSTLTLVDAAAAADFPDVANVRSGVTFDNGDKVGTCAVPGASEVAYGVPVDNTTGTAVLTAAGVTAAVWDAARSGHATDGTFGDTAEWAGSVDTNAIATAAAAAILAAADSDPISANVTYSAGVALAGRLAEYADVNPLALEATAQAILASVNTIDDFLDTEIAAILADTNELQTDLVNGGRLDLLIDAIKAKTDVIPASPAAVGSEMLLTAAYDAAKTAATQASVDDLPTNAELATALGTADDATLAAIAALNNLSSAQAQAAATAALEAYDPPTNAEMVARTLLAASYFDPATDTVARVTLVDTTTTNTDMVAAAPSAATVADAVWDEALSGHAGAGSTGAALSASGAAGDPWSTALPGAYGAGTAGKLLSDIEAVAPDNKPTVDASGVASANVTHHAGVAVAAADANGNVPVVLYPTQGAVTFNGQVKILADVGGEGALHVVNSHANGHGQRNQGGNAGQYNYGSNGQYNYGSYAGQYNYGSYNGQYNYGLTEAGQLNQGSLPIIGAAQQEIADALKLAPAAGTPAPGSVYGLLGDAAIDPQAVRDAMKLAPSAGAPAAGSVDAHLDAVALEATAQAVLTAVNAIEPGGGSYAGDGTGYYTDTIDDGTNPLDGVRVQLYTAQNRVGPAYEAYTNALGVFEMWPDPGTYYRWLDYAGVSFAQDVAVVVTEP